MEDNIYNDPNDPSIDDIKKNTENIVVNDITLPVIDDSKPEIKPGEKSGVFQVSNENNKDTTTVKGVGDTENHISQSITEENKDTGVKMFSFDTLYPGMKTFSSITKEETQVGDTEKKTLNTLGTITENETAKGENIDKTVENISQNNDNILKEVMKLDKNEENIDETETLDNFFNDVKKIAGGTNKDIDVDKKENSYTFFD